MLLWEKQIGDGFISLIICRHRYKGAKKGQKRSRLQPSLRLLLLKKNSFQKTAKSVVIKMELFSIIYTVRSDKRLYFTFNLDNTGVEIDYSN